MYKRNIQLKLFILRLIFIAAVIVIFWLFKKGQPEYGYFLITVLIFCSVNTVTGLEIDYELLRITQYFLFGFIPFQIVFKKGDHINLSSFEVEFSDQGSGIVGELLVFPSPPDIKMYTVTHTAYGGKTRKVKLRLSQHELDLINLNFIKTQEQAELLDSSIFEKGNI